MVGTWAWYFIIQPHRRLDSSDWLETASAEQVRETCHRALTTPLVDHHDAFMRLGRIGTRDSVPRMIRALRWHEPETENGASCVAWHGALALASLTGRHGTVYADDWQAWWSEVGHALPAEHFHPRSRSELFPEAEETAAVPPEAVRATDSN